MIRLLTLISVLTGFSSDVLAQSKGLQIKDIDPEWYWGWIDYLHGRKPEIEKTGNPFEDKRRQEEAMARYRELTATEYALPVSEYVFTNFRYLPGFLDYDTYNFETHTLRVCLPQDIAIHTKRRKSVFLSLANPLYPRKDRSCGSNSGMAGVIMGTSILARFRNNEIAETIFNRTDGEDLLFDFSCRGKEHGLALGMTAGHIECHYEMVRVYAKSSAGGILFEAKLGYNKEVGEWRYNVTLGATEFLELYDRGELQQ